MAEEKPLFILAGNGPYENRGCEAIVRGTTRILREYFSDPQFMCVSFFQDKKQFKKQCEQETDSAITHLQSRSLPDRQGAILSVYKPEIWQGFYQYFFKRNAFPSWIYRDMLPYLDDSIAVLSIGGDNYSLDYGVPKYFTALDDLILAHKRPLAIWGASVGPFSAKPDYEQYMRDHLKKITRIFARESTTLTYLESIGIVNNVCHVADPAFLMEPSEPVGIEENMPIEKGSIGLNLSPLMAKYITGGDLEQWSRIAASIISGVGEKTEMPIYLIPHVTIPHSDDFAFLQKVASLIPESKRTIIVVPPVYNAAETKWIIGRMALFAGARTHATIAALSSGVPTLSFSYSIKSGGINRDIFGHTRYCMNPLDLDVKTVKEKITSMLDEAPAIRRNLHDCIPGVQRSAQHAGFELSQIVMEKTKA
jgi:polysaccharide pyruvyl transferase WcaK-like protein